ncbi:MAG TPA: hypothetical protein VGI40_25270 [Pirellulaceae bacterium]|jgi:hypothetical protein
MPSRQHLVIGISIAALVLANLTADVGLLWLSSEILQHWSPLNEAAIGLLLGQVMLVGLWMGLGDGRWYVRGAIATALTISIARTLNIAAVLSPKESRNEDPAFWASVAFVLIPMMLAAAICGLMLRRFRGWRLTFQAATIIIPTTQFQIADALLWTTLISAGLAAVRFLASINAFEDQLPELTLLTVRSLLAAICASVAAFSTRRRIRTGLWLSLTVLLIGAAFAVPDVYASAKWVFGRWMTPVAFWQFIGPATSELMKNEAFVVAVALSTLANCLVLRALGCRLLRPGSRGGPSVAADCD